MDIADEIDQRLRALKGTLQVIALNPHVQGYAETAGVADICYGAMLHCDALESLIEDLSSLRPLAAVA